MIVELIPHPDTPCPAVTRFTVEVWRTRAQVLHLRYALEGDVEAIVWPIADLPQRTDGLWKATCFEAFVAGPGEGYREFNFAPSGRWAAYDFEGYREGMRPARVTEPEIEVEYADGLVLLEAAATAPPEAMALGLSAVIQGVDGKTAYFAAAHPPGKPDFHHADCFALPIPAPDRG